MIFVTSTLSSYLHHTPVYHQQLATCFEDVCPGGMKLLRPQRLIC